MDGAILERSWSGMESKKYLKTKKIRLTDRQCADLSEPEEPLRQMCKDDPEKPGVMLAQVLPQESIMRVRVFDYAVGVKVAEALMIGVVKDSP